MWSQDGQIQDKYQLQFHKAVTLPPKKLKYIVTLTWNSIFSFDNEWHKLLYVVHCIFDNKGHNCTGLHLLQLTATCAINPHLKPTCYIILTRIRNIKNVTRCRDSRSAKSIGGK